MEKDHVTIEFNAKTNILCYCSFYETTRWGAISISIFFDLQSSQVVRWLKAEHPMKEQGREEIQATADESQCGKIHSFKVDKNLRPGSKYQ